MSEKVDCFLDSVEVHLVELETFTDDIKEVIKEIRKEMNVLSEEIERKELLEGLGAE